MASENEPAKLLLPYLQRADELQKHEPLVAYYCRLYAMERGLKIPSGERTKTTNSLFISLMKQLEKDKKSLQLGPEDNLHLEGFALNVFSKADKQDRAGRADLNTAKTFYAASIFFEILNQFGPLQPDIEEKQKYAAWKAADIRKAVKEGRKPNPGPPLSEEDLAALKSTSSGSYDLGPSGMPASGSPRPQPDSSSDFHDNVNSSANTTPSQSHDTVDNPFSANIPPSAQNYPSTSYPSHDLHQPPPNPSRDFHPPARDPSHDFHRPPPMDHPSHDFHQPPPANLSHDFHPPPPPSGPESSGYSQPYVHQPFPQDPQHMPPNYPTQDAPSFPYPNFQTYPSLNETSLPSVPSHYPSHYQDTSYSQQSAPPTVGNNFTETSQYSSGGRNGASELMPAPAQKFEYDSNYQPSPEKIAEAHKAARFAVGALAFDDVPVAVDFLKKSLELLTNPSVSH